VAIISASETTVKVVAATLLMQREGLARLAVGSRADVRGCSDSDADANDRETRGVAEGRIQSQRHSIRTLVPSSEDLSDLIQDAER
jgi:hypothetical protein